MTLAVPSLVEPTRKSKTVKLRRAGRAQFSSSCWETVWSGLLQSRFAVRRGVVVLDIVFFLIHGRIWFELCCWRRARSRGSNAQD